MKLQKKNKEEIADLPEGIQQWTLADQIDSGIKLIEKSLKLMPKPADKKAFKTAKETVGVIKKQARIMKKDEKMKLQYEEKVAYSTIQLLFQVFHLLILSNAKNPPKDSVEAFNKYNNDKLFYQDIIDHIACTRDVYSLAESIAKDAEARADFTPSRKKVL